MEIKIPNMDEQQRFVFEQATNAAIEQLRQNLQAPVIKDLVLMSRSTVMSICYLRIGGSRRIQILFVRISNSLSSIRLTPQIKLFLSFWGLTIRMVCGGCGLIKQAKSGHRMGFGGGCWWPPDGCRRRLCRWSDFLGSLRSNHLAAANQG